MEKERPIEPERRPTINNLNQLQEVYAHFSRSLNPGATPREMHEMLQDEVYELSDAIDTKDRQEIGAEIADVIFLAVELANQHGIVLEDAISAKMERNYHKYNPFEMQQLMSQGMSRRDAQQYLKANWNRARDREFK